MWEKGKCIVNRTLEWVNVVVKQKKRWQVNVAVKQKNLPTIKGNKGKQVNVGEEKKVKRCNAMVV